MPRRSNGQGNLKRGAITIVAGTSVVETAKIAAGFTAEPTPIQIALTAFVAIFAGILVIVTTNGTFLKNALLFQSALKKTGAVNSGLQ